MAACSRALLGRASRASDVIACSTPKTLADPSRRAAACHRARPLPLHTPCSGSCSRSSCRRLRPPRFTAPRAAGWLLALLPASIAVYLLATAGSAGVLAERYAWVPLLDVELSFYADGLSRLFAVLVTGIGAIVLVYAGAYLKDERKH